MGKDETDTKVNSAKIWMQTWQKTKTTFIIALPNRGYATIEKHFLKGFPKSILASDCWKSHFQPEAVEHKLCVPHLIMELNYFQECYQSGWAEKCKSIFIRAMKIGKKMHPDDYLNHQPPRSQIEAKMDKLLLEDSDVQHKKITIFKKRLCKYRAHLFTFLYHIDVPRDNNASERAIRNIKKSKKYLSSLNLSMVQTSLL